MTGLVMPSRTADAQAAPVREGRRRNRRRWLGLAYLAPALILYGIVVLYPVGQSMWLSLFSWDAVNPATWTGLANYTAFFSDPELGQAFTHTLVLIFFYAVLPMVLGLISAALVTRKGTSGLGLFRSILFLPQVMTSVVVAVVWNRIYGPDGPINEALRAMGLGDLTRNWLGDFTWALPALGMVGTWVTFGFCMVLFVSGVQSIPYELYEAVRIDGGGQIREFFTVTLPNLRGQFAIALTLTVISALRAFDLIWLTTRGGPGTSTMTPAILLYQSAFVDPDVGRAAAIGVVMALLALVITLFITRFVEGKDS